MSEQQKKKDVDYFGGCPICGKAELLNVGREQWMACLEHWVSWCIGSNLLSCWKDENEQIWSWNKKRLSDCTEVEPIYEMAYTAVERQNWEHPKICVKEHKGVRNSGCPLCHSGGPEPEGVHYFIEGTTLWVCRRCATKHAPLLDAVHIDRNELSLISELLGTEDYAMLKAQVDDVNDVLQGAQ